MSEAQLLSKPTVYIVAAERIYSAPIKEGLESTGITVVYSKESPHHPSNAEKIIAEIIEKKPQAILIHAPNLDLDDNLSVASAIAQKFKGQIPVLVSDSLPFDHPGFQALSKVGAITLFNEYTTHAIISSINEAIILQPKPEAVPPELTELTKVIEIKNNQDDRFSLIIRAMESSLGMESSGKKQRLFCFDYPVFLKPKNAEALQAFLTANNIESAGDFLQKDGSILITSLRGITDTAMFSIPNLVQFLQEICGWKIGSDISGTIHRAMDAHSSADDRVFQPLERIAARKPIDVVKLTPNDQPLSREMQQIHEMVLNVLTRYTMAAICYSDEMQMAYVMRTGNPLTSNGDEAEGILARILARPKVKALTNKIEAKYPITLNEFREFLDEVNGVNHFVGWVLRDGAKSTVEPLFQGKSPTVGTGPTTTAPDKTTAPTKPVAPTTAPARTSTTNTVPQKPVVSPARAETTDSATVREPAHERDVVNGVLNQLSWTITVERGAKLAKAEITTRDVSRLNQNIKYGAGVGVATRPLSAKWRYEISFPEKAFSVLQAKGVQLIERPSPKFA